MIRTLTTILLAVSLAGSLVYGSGFSIYEQGSKAKAMSGAFAAQANDVSAIFYNPAGITALPGFQIGVGVTLIMPQAHFYGPAAVDPNLWNASKEEVFTPPTFYATYKINEKWSAGFGFFVPFGLGSDWGEDWSGKYLATKSEVQTFFLNPVIAYKVMDNLSIALGFEYVLGNVTLEKAVWYPVRNLDIYSKLDASGSGMGFNAGIQYKPLNGLTLGLNYRSNVTLKFEDGDATFTYPIGTSHPLYPELQAFFPDTKGSSEIKLPIFMALGIAYDFTDNLTAEFDYLHIGWNSYDELVIDFKDPVAGRTQTVSERKYKDSASYRLGMEYRINEQLAVRGGYMRDLAAVPDERVEPSLPEGDRHIYNIGLGYKFSDFTIDGSYMILLQDDREVENTVDGFDGKYKNLANLYGLSFGYTF